MNYFGRAIRRAAQLLKHNKSCYRNIDIKTYPTGKRMQFINRCRPGYKMVIEDMGNFNRVQSHGIFMGIPILQQIAYVVDTRPLIIDISTHAWTMDNYSIDIDIQLNVQFIDVKRLCYNSSHPLMSLASRIQSIVRMSATNYNLNSVFTERIGITRTIMRQIKQDTIYIGIKMIDLDITNIRTDKHNLKTDDIFLL